MKNIFLCLLMLCVSGCSKTDGVITQGSDGELVGVNFDLQVGAQLTPVCDQAGKSASQVIATERTESVLAELVRSDRSNSKALDDTTISNFWIFQYNGTTSSSQLVYKKYYPTYTAGQAFELASGLSQRVVVIANTFSSSFGDAELLNFSSYQSVLNRAMSVTTESSLFPNSGNSVVISGSKVLDIALSSTVRVELKRNVTQVAFRVKLGTGSTAITATSWKIQMCKVPNQSFYLPDYYSTDPSVLYPSVVTPTDYAEQSVAGMNSTTFTDFRWSVPVNRRGVKQGTVAKARRTNAPLMATYVKISADTPERTVNYYIHLGANFAEDYNLNPNYQYTYQVTLYDVTETPDSRVEVISKLPIVIESGVAAPRLYVVNPGDADNAMLQLTRSPLNFGAYFQWMSTVAYNYGVNTPVYWTQATQPTWSTVWTSTTIHSAVSILGGGGDPCRLVGYTAKQVRDAALKGVALDNKKWRMPTNAENAVLAAVYSNWFAATAGVRVAGRFFGVGASADNTIGQYLTASGSRTAAGAFSNQNTRGYYWSSRGIGTNGYNIYFFSDATVIPEQQASQATGFPIRCVEL